MDLHIHDLVISDRHSIVTRASSKKAHLVKIRRGIYLPLDLIPQNAPRWQVRRTVTQARALALSLAKDRDHPPVLTLESALALHGLPTWINSSDIRYRRECSSTGRASQILSPVTIHGVEVCSVNESHIRSARFSNDHDDVNGVLLSPLWEIALDCARYLHPLAAVVGASSALHRLTSFDMHKQTGPRKRETSYKDDMLERICRAPRFRNSVRAKRIIEIADAGMATPGEGCLLWLLHCIVKDAVTGELSEHLGKHGPPPTTEFGHNSRRTRFQSEATALSGPVSSGNSIEIFTQYEIIANGNQYFGDLAIPSHRIVIEFDGGEKIQDPSARYAFLKRQRDLMSVGWQVVRIDPTMLNRPRQLIEYLMRQLSALGVPVRYPQGPLWSPIPRELLDYRRRH